MSRTQPSGSHVARLLVDHELAVSGVSGLGHIYDKTFAALAPVIGDRGVHGIFERALELIQLEHPALRSFVVEDEPSAASASLAACMLATPPDAARAAAIALYADFFGLVVTFVGFELTVRLLHSAWPEVDFKETP